MLVNLQSCCMSYSYLWNSTYALYSIYIFSGCCRCHLLPGFHGASLWHNLKIEITGSLIISNFDWNDWSNHHYVVFRVVLCLESLVLIWPKMCNFSLLCQHFYALCCVLSLQRCLLSVAFVQIWCFWLSNPQMVQARPDL